MLKRVNIFLGLAILCLATTCKKEGEACHRSIKFTNNSADQIILAQAFGPMSEPSKCHFFVMTDLDAGSSYEDSFRECFEHRLENRPYEYFIIDPNDFDNARSYNCDSIQYASCVLVHKVMTSDDVEYLKKNDFTITYP